MRATGLTSTQVSLCELLFDNAFPRRLDRGPWNEQTGKSAISASFADFSYAASLILHEIIHIFHPQFACKLGGPVSNPT